MKKYTSTAIFLHWSIAIAIFSLLISGWVLHYELLQDKQFIFQLFQWHKSIGVTILLLVVLRIFWRITHQPPALPAALQKDSAKIHLGHVLIYALLIIMPLSGWVLVSTNPQGIPTIVFGLFQWFHLPLGEASFKPAKTIHYYTAFIIAAIVIGHVFLALKHQSQGVLILARMQASFLVKSGLILSLVAVVLLSINLFKIQSSSASIDNITLNSGSQANKIQFSGTHADNEFKGVFQEWVLDTDIDFSAQMISTFSLVVDMGSAVTGVALFDDTLKEKDWFDSATFPESTFQFISAKFQTKQNVIIEGSFKIKEKIVPLELNLSLDENNFLSTTFVLQRSEIGLGQEADPDADWVSENITVKALVELKN